MNQFFSVNRFFIISAITLLITSFSAMAQEPDWLVRLKQQKWMEKVVRLKLLKTSRAEARKILGEPEKPVFSDESYISKNSTVDITYTTKECTSIDGKIDKDTTEEIKIFLKQDISFSKLKIPLKEFIRTPFYDTPGATYSDKRNGIRMGVYEGDDNKIKKLIYVEFFIPEQKNFSCVTVSSFLRDLGKVRNIKLLGTNQEDVRKLFAEYGEPNSYNSSEYKDKYYTSDAGIEVFYSQGKCEFDYSDEYESKEKSVQRIKVSPNNNIFPQEFGIDLSKYKKEQIYNNSPNLYIYYDKEEGLSIEVFEGKISEINFFPSQKYNSSMCDKEQAKILSATESLFTEKLADRISPSNRNASVENIYLNKREIVVGKPVSSQEKTSQENSQTINISTRVNNPNGDVLIYSYIVSDGKIVGQGAKVIWDLSGVKTGIHTISVAVDGGCGFCGKSASKTVVVK